MTADDLLNDAKAAGRFATDMAFAERLGVTRQAVSNWRVGRAFPDAVACEKLAVLSGIPLHRVLGVVGEARAISVAEKRVWRKLAAALFVSLLLLPLTSFAAVFPTNGDATSRHYAKSRGLLRRFFTWLRAQWRALMESGDGPPALLA
jgi:transcriptional regulator with XRE-family HTH domain